ncbi:MAG: cell division protein FtsZ [Melioribacteraceae bacterium]|nr:cell division protein FtsZ [Melioribacteraceae bacterium]MCF8354528.1 cell division protein FtsZ [Melioribacteraceae bacterium]MCF8394297.1 cell division protein FtsZ [Melioribacteraceae bacterium]MCF8418197.1 cell division protein FtsZ [Melioribacteraceae bacterium]
MTKFVTLDRERPMSAVLKVVGVGGGGCNAIESMMKRGLQGVEYVAVNTDAQVLEKSSAQHKIQIGKNITRGLGAGADPNVGRKALEEDREKLTKVLEGSDMVFVTSGMGGGTGTGGAPIVASIAKSLGSLVIGIVTKPFRWEGKKRMLNAEDGIHEMRQYVDSLIVIPNERLLSILDKTVSAATAFDKPNEVLYEATRGIADIITIPGIINVDFADVRSVMNESGEALMGCGIASGDNRAVEAAQKAISSPLLEGISIKGAKNILLNVSGSTNLTMQEIDEGNKIIYDSAGEEANIIFGWVSKEEMNEYVSYTVIATGFNSASYKGGISNLNKVSEEDETREKKKTAASGLGAGYKGRPMEVSEDDDLDVPTIFRVKGSNKNLLKEDTVTEGGFQFEQFDAFEQKEKEKDRKRNRENRDDSSSFLRMMMD